VDASTFSLSQAWQQGYGFNQPQLYLTGSFILVSLEKKVTIHHQQDQGK